MKGGGRVPESSSLCSVPVVEVTSNSVNRVYKIQRDPLVVKCLAIVGQTLGMVRHQVDMRNSALSLREPQRAQILPVPRDSATLVVPQPSWGSLHPMPEPCVAIKASPM